VAYLVVIAVYSATQIALGLWVSLRLRGSSDFFVAGRSLGPGLLAATLLAANIGGGSTIGAAGAGFRDGVSAWWWIGSAGIGSIVLAWWVGPRIRRIAAEHDLKTVGDFLEWRYDARVRAAIAVLLWAGTVAILAGQLLSMSALFGTVIGLSKPIGCVIGGGVATAYFAAGGLKSSVAVNVVQVTVKLLGFAIAFPLALSAAGGLDGLHASIADPGQWNIVRNGSSGWIYVPMLTPAFIVSPGLLQKVYAARDDRAVRIGVGGTRSCCAVCCDPPSSVRSRGRAIRICWRRISRCRRSLRATCRSDGRTRLAASFGGGQAPPTPSSSCSRRRSRRTCTSASSGRTPTMRAW
jgi:SSS family solute:Na+ symporter